MMRNLFKFKKCNKNTKWVIYSKSFMGKMLKSHPMVAPVLINSHIEFLNKGGKEHKHYYEQSDVMSTILLPKINEINKNKDCKQLYAERMVTQKGIFDVMLSSTLEEQLEFLNWYYNKILPVDILLVGDEKIT
jgi:hypothetical protein